MAEENKKENRSILILLLAFLYAAFNVVVGCIGVATIAVFHHISFILTRNSGFWVGIAIAFAAYYLRDRL